MSSAATLHATTREPWTSPGKSLASLMLLIPPSLVTLTKIKLKQRCLLTLSSISPPRECAALLKRTLTLLRTSCCTRSSTVLTPQTATNSSGKLHPLQFLLLVLNTLKEPTNLFSTSLNLKMETLATVSNTLLQLFQVNLILSQSHPIKCTPMFTACTPRTALPQSTLSFYLKTLLRTQQVMLFPNSTLSSPSTDPDLSTASLNLLLSLSPVPLRKTLRSI
jgi:hypothetical protein